MPNHLQFHLVSHSMVQLGDQILGGIARKQPAVQFHQHSAGHNVYLLTTPNHRSVGRIAEQGLKGLSFFAHQFQNRVCHPWMQELTEHRTLRPRQFGGDSLDHAPSNRRNVHGQAALLQPT